MKPMKQTISRISRPKLSRRNTFGGRRDGGEAHILVVVHSEMMYIEWQNGKQEDQQPQPVMTNLEECSHYVNDQQAGKCVTHVIEVVCTE